MNDDTRFCQNAKRELRKAERSLEAGDPPGYVISRCDTLLLAFDTCGYPDWWQDVERLKSDAQLKLTYG